MKKMIIYGLGPFAELINFYFTEDSDYEFVAFTVDKAYMSDSDFLGKPVVEFESITDKYPPNEYDMFVAIGYKVMKNRGKLYLAAKSKSYKLVNYISSNAITYSDLIIGDNNVIMGGVNVEPFVEVGNNNVFWSNTLLGHNLKVGSHNYVSACCLLGGDCIVKDCSFICNGAGMINGLSVGNNTKLLPGSMLYKDMPEGTQWLGIPAKKMGMVGGK